MLRIIFILFVAAAVTACGGDVEERTATRAGAAPRDVVVAFYPLEWLVTSLAGDAVDVRNLTPAGAEPHDLELSPKDVAALRAADLVLYAGGGFQPALEDAIDRAGKNVEAVDVLELDGVEILHVGDRPDPHVWLDPTRFAAVAREVATLLDVEVAEVEQTLDRLDDAYQRGVARCARRELFTTHAAFGYLADRYDLEQIAISGVSPESEPSPQALEDFSEEVREADATTIFFEPLAPADVAETVARDLGITTTRLDPLEGLTAERLDANHSYLSVMEDNLAALQAGLGCRV